MEGLRPPDAAWQLRLAADAAADHAFVLLDTEGRVTWWSHGAERIFGYAPSEIVGRASDILFTPEDIEDGIPGYERRVSMSDGPAEDDRWMRRKDGSRFWASGILVRIRDEAGTHIGFGKILRNRTDLKEQLEALRNQAREFEADARLKNAFLGTLSHELRNPLAPITSALAIVRGRLPDPPQDVAYAIKVIERQTHLLQRLVEDLMDLTRAGTGKIELRREPLDLVQLVRECVDDVADKTRQRRHQVEVLATDARVMVLGDRDRLQQVMVNLLVNAAKYTPEGGRIWVKASTEGEDALVKVGDNGVGIPTDMLPRIFDLFTQVESSRALAQGGLGIGLALVKNIVSLHGGSVQVRSDGTGKGSEFAVRLPLLAT